MGSKEVFMAGGMQGGTGGYGYPAGAPPPMPVRKSSNSCLIWALGGCGVLVVIFVIVSVIGITQFMKNPAMKQAMNSKMAASRCAYTLQKIGGALEGYRKDHSGKYPATLTGLVPKYLADKSELTCGEESGMEVEYTPPKPE